MHLEIPLHHWDLANQSLREHFAIQEGQNLRLYSSFAHGVYEAVHGTTQFFPHKKGLAYFKNQSPLLTPIFSPYMKEGYQIISPNHADFAEEIAKSDISTWVDALPKDILMVAFAEDHPVTGEVFPWTQELEKKLNEKRIICVILSHHKHIDDAQSENSERRQILPFTTKILSVSDGAAVAVLGARVRTPSLFAHLVNFGKSEIDDVAKIRHIKSDLLAVKKFEAEVSDFAASYFRSDTARTGTRAAIYFADVSGDAVMGELAPYEHLLSTPHPCLWQSFGLYRDWWKPEPDFNQLARTLFVSVEAIAQPDFVKALRDAVLRLQKDQSF